MKEKIRLAYREGKMKRKEEWEMDDEMSRLFGQGKPLTLSVFEMGNEFDLYLG